MALSIKDPETDELARELARETGESLTDAVRAALRERLERQRRRRGERSLAPRLLAIGRRSAAALAPGGSSADHGDLLYDEHGLPR